MTTFLKATARYGGYYRSHDDLYRGDRDSMIDLKVIISYRVRFKKRTEPNALTKRIQIVQKYRSLEANALLLMGIGL